MTINGVDISTWNAKQRTITPNQHHKLNSDSEWLPGSAVPYLSNLYVVMRSFTVTLWVYGANRNEINQNYVGQSEANGDIKIQMACSGTDFCWILAW